MASTTTDVLPSTSVTVHLAEKTTRKALNRLKKLEPEVLAKKLETIQERAAQLTIKLVRARKELQDLETAKLHLENPNAELAQLEGGKKRKRVSKKKAEKTDEEATTEKQEEDEAEAKPKKAKKPKKEDTEEKPKKKKAPVKEEEEEADADEE
jgi:hypothetical protein